MPVWVTGNLSGFVIISVLDFLAPNVSGLIPSPVGTRVIDVVAKTEIRKLSSDVAEVLFAGVLMSVRKTVPEPMKVTVSKGMTESFGRQAAFLRENL